MEESTTLLSVLVRQSRQFASRTALSIRDRGQWRELSYSALTDRSTSLAEALIERGVGGGSRVLLLCESRPEWVIGFFAILLAGGVAVPVDPKLDPEELSAILAHSGAEAVLASRQTESEAEGLASTTPGPVRVLLIDELDAMYVESELDADAAALRIRDRQPADVVLMSYTSGTTGTPKAVMITLANLLFEISALCRSHGLNENDRFLSILPLNHLLELTCGLLTPLHVGAEVVYASTLFPGEIVELLAEKRITTLIGVPLFFRLLHQSIEAQMARSLSSRTYFRVAGMVVSLIPLQRLRRALYSPVQKALGGSIRRFISGGSPLDRRAALFFERMGLPLFQGYGLSETSPVATVNRPGANRAGSVGQPLGNSEVRIDDPQTGTGEVLVRGPHVMKGYFRDEKLTARTIDADGWLHTGDIGRIDDGYLYITGRLKSLIVLPDGRKVQPEEVESVISQSNLIKEVCVSSSCATSGPRAGCEEVCAVVVPSDAAIQSWGSSPAMLHSEIANEITRLAAKLRDYKRPSSVVVREAELPRTTTRKVRRLEVQRWLIDRESTR
ncbi:MAG: AMP-binding protein [Acidobacteriota bacterium]